MLPKLVERQVALDAARIVDIAADGSEVGIEFISASRGVNLTGGPGAAEGEREVRGLGRPLRSAPADVARPG
jgi:hypothetical protein